MKIINLAKFKHFKIISTIIKSACIYVVCFYFVVLLFFCTEEKWENISLIIVLVILFFSNYIIAKKIKKIGKNYLINSLILILVSILGLFIGYALLSIILDIGIIKNILMTFTFPEKSFEEFVGIFWFMFLYLNFSLIVYFCVLFFRGRK
jgi:hypothetical protein